MNRFRFAILLLICFICRPAYALDPGNYPIRDLAREKKIACPAQDFSEFIIAFSENIEVQMAFTKYPLQQQRLDANAEPEPKPVLRELRREQVSFPVIPNQAERKKQSLVFRINENKSNYKKLTILKDDSDYQVDYFFSRNSCWRLERIEDWSF